MDSTATGEVPHEDLCVVSGGSSRPRLLVAGSGTSGDFAPEHTLADFFALQLSPDGSTLYFASAGWVTSSAAHAVDLSTGVERYLVDGVIVATLERGPYKGMLLASHFRIDFAHHPELGRHETWSVVSPVGKMVRELPEEERARSKALEGK